MGSRACRRAISCHGTRGECRMPAVPRRGPGTSRYTGPAVYPYCCFQAPVAALPAPFSYTHRPGRSGRHGPAGSGVDSPIPQNSFGCVVPKMGSRACRRAISRHGPGGECRMPEGGLPWTVYPGPPTRTRLPWTARPEPTSQPVYPAPPTQTRLPCAARRGRPPSPSTLDRPPGPASQPFQINASVFDFKRRRVMDFLAKTLAPSTLSL